MKGLMKAVTEGVKEVSKEIAKEGPKLVKILDKPLNAAENKLKELVSGETGTGNRWKELDRPLNSLEHGKGGNLPGDISGREDGNKCMETDKNVFRMLSEEEKNKLKEDTKWSDKSVEGCRINGDGVIRFPCRNGELAGKTNEDGIKYEKQIVEVYGYQVEVVMPKFESVFDVKLPDGLREASDREQFKECNRQLLDAWKENPDLAEKFTEEQLEQIKEGITGGGAPDGYVWHHDAPAGKMQLVDADLHGDARHTGGRVIWGGGNENR